MAREIDCSSQSDHAHWSDMPRKAVALLTRAARMLRIHGRLAAAQK